MNSCNYRSYLFALQHCKLYVLYICRVNTSRHTTPRLYPLSMNLHIKNVVQICSNTKQKSYCLWTARPQGITPGDMWLIRTWRGQSLSALHPLQRTGAHISVLRYTHSTLGGEETPMHFHGAWTCNFYLTVRCFTVARRPAKRQPGTVCSCNLASEQYLSSIYIATR